MKEILFGAAYYDEYMPCERLPEDIRMMKKAGMNVVRIAESTWSTCEPQEGTFDFSHVERVMDAMEAAGISVIIGTPTYAIPAWMVKSHPDVLAETARGRGIYGCRQIMDITHPVFLFHAERVIRELMKRTAHRKCVIGFQVDNETKHYGTAGRNVQERFVKYLRKKFNDDLIKMNAEFGLDYWSNRIDAWEDFPDVRGTINGSLGAEFGKFQRALVDEYLGWQAGIVREYCREDQFVTQNFDYEWRGYSFGVQPDVNHFHAAKCLTIAAADIYHPTQDALTGAEIAFCGDMARSLKRDNYLVMETEAQGYPDWLPYRGQLRLQAYSHIASGANSVMYWHWHSLHNGCETYWKGILSQDFQENDTYREACAIGAEFGRIGSHIVNLKKKNQVAMLISNESLTALKWFPIDASSSSRGKLGYNDAVRWMYDALYEMGVECDMVWPESEHLEDYQMIVVPALYAAPDELLRRLSRYVEHGGTLVATFKTAFANENVKVGHEAQPRILRECLGVAYHHFTFPKDVALQGGIVPEGAQAEAFMELLETEGAEALASYDHYNWGRYAAATRNHFGSGNAYYIGCMTGKETLKRMFDAALKDAEVEYGAGGGFPVIVRAGINDFGRQVWFYLNYSQEERTVAHKGEDGKNLLTGEAVAQGGIVTVGAWDVQVVEGLK